jgi:hypothetical protein
MKRFLLLLIAFLLVPVAFSKPWGAMKDCVPTPYNKPSRTNVKNALTERITDILKSPDGALPLIKDPKAGKSFSFNEQVFGKHMLKPIRDKNATQTLIPRIMQGKPLRYVVGGEVPAQELMVAKQYTLSGLEAWFVNVRGLLRGREEEFRDVFTLFNQEIKMELVDVAQDKLEEIAKNFLANRKDSPLKNSLDIDLFVYVFKDPASLKAICGQGAAACEFVVGQIIFLATTKDSNLSVYVHELGHGLGLVDLYAGGWELSMSKSFHSHYIVAPSTMMGGMIHPDSMADARAHPQDYSDGQPLTCDDADGLINLIDAWTANPAKRVTEGWQSLCNRDECYKNGTTAGKCSS